MGSRTVCGLDAELLDGAISLDGIDRFSSGR
jgi:hypothetical protein